MSRIISGVPVQMTITYNETNGAVSFQTTKDLEFTTVVTIFCQLIIQFVRDGINKQNAALAEAARKGGGGNETPPAA